MSVSAGSLKYPYPLYSDKHLPCPPSAFLEGVGGSASTISSEVHDLDIVMSSQRVEKDGEIVYCGEIVKKRLSSPGLMRAKKSGELAVFTSTMRTAPASSPIFTVPFPLATGGAGAGDGLFSCEDDVCGGAGAIPQAPGAHLLSDDVSMVATNFLFSPEHEKFFKEMKSTDIRSQSFFQTLHAALSSKGIGCMSSADLWQELNLVYQTAEYLLSQFGDITSSLYVHKANPQLPRSFILWTVEDRAYVTILLNRHKIPQEGGDIKGDERFPAVCREKKFSFGLYFRLFQNVSVKRVLVASRIPKKPKEVGEESFMSEYDIYKTLPPSQYLARIYIGVNKSVPGKEGYQKHIYVMPFYEQSDVFNLIEKMCGKEEGKEDHTPLISLMFKQIAEVLALLHDHGIVHRDVKPENIFKKFKEINPTKPSRKTPQRFLLADYEFTRKEPIKRSFVGTPQYLSPAFFQDAKPVDYKAADVWALGVTVLSAYSDKDPFIDSSKKRISLKEITQLRVDAIIAYCFASNYHAAKLDPRIKKLVRDMLLINDKERITMRQVSTYINSYLPD